MLERLGHFVFHRRKLVLVAALLAFLAAGVFGGSVFGSLKTGGFDDPASDSSKARQLLVHQFHQGDPNLVLVVTATGGNVDDPAVAKAANDLLSRLAADKDVAGQAFSYWSLGSPAPLKSTKGDRALVLVRLSGEDTYVDKRVGELTPKLEADTGGGLLKVQATGLGAVFHQVGSTIEKDLQRAELIAFPLTALLLVFVFGSAVAAALPLAIGVISIVGTLAALKLITLFTDVSVFSINLTTALGLGLAIDYSLFIVSRYREELRKGRSNEDAIVKTLTTAGKTVLFSALTVAAALAALLVFPLYFLRSFAYAGVAVVGCGAAASLIVLPAMLAALGANVERFRIIKREPKPDGEGFWHRLAVMVMRRPIPVALSIGAVLVILGLPFFGAKFGLPDDRVLPKSAHARQAAEILRTDFTSRESSALSVVAPDAGNAKDPVLLSKVDAYARKLAAVSGVARVDAITGSYVGTFNLAANGAPAYARFAGPTGGTFLSVVPSIEPQSEAGEAFTTAVRAVPSPIGKVLVTGQSAQLVDGKASLAAKLPIAGGIIALTTFVVLFMMFGSLLVPAKAVVLNLLSLTATFGAMVWIFQEGRGAGFLDFTATGTLDTTTPILMFCVAFGLSMDYEVFLLSRIKEEHDRGADSVTAVAMGLEKTGRIVTAAAALLAVVFISFATSGITFIKLFGIGLTMAVLMDATLIRGTLVPAFMRLAGEANWWAPGPLRRFHDKYGFSESESQSVPEDDKHDGPRGGGGDRGHGPTPHVAAGPPTIDIVIPAPTPVAAGRPVRRDRPLRARPAPE